MAYLKSSGKGKVLKRNGSIFYGETRDNNMEGKGYSILI